MKRTVSSSFFFFSSLIILSSTLHAKVQAAGEANALPGDKNPSVGAEDLQSLIRKSRENIRDVDGKIKEQEIFRRNQEREQKAREYYEQAQKMAVDGRLDEARKLYDKALKITEHPEMKKYIKESKGPEDAAAAVPAVPGAERLPGAVEEGQNAAVDSQAEARYQTAVALFDKAQYAEAQAGFRDVQNLVSNYRATRDYLAKIAALMQTDAERKIVADDMARRKAEKENTEKKMLAAGQKFTEAVELYKMGRLIDAREKFMALDQEVPDYKDSRDYLRRIDDEIAAMVTAKRRGSELVAQKQELDRLKEIRDRAEYVYNEAVVAYDNREYEKAKKGFQDTEDIYPNYKKATYYLARIDEDIRKHQEQIRREGLEKQAEWLYAQAMALYGSDQFEQAKKKFIEVTALIPDYKQTAFYLERIDDDIIRKKEKTLNEIQVRQADVLYNQAVALYQSAEYAQAKDKFIELEAVAPRYKDAARYLATIDQDIFRKKEETEQRLKADQAEEIYKQALALYKVRDFESAKEKFIRIEVVFPDYKDTAKYLSSVDGDIERKRQDEEQRARAAQADPIYIQAIDLYRSQELNEAKKKFLQVQSVYPDYKETGKYLVRVEEDMRLLEERLARVEKTQKLDRAYVEALRLYSIRDFEGAKGKFIEVSGLDPNYKSVKNYLAHIDVDIRDEKARKERAVLEEKALPIYAQAMDLYHGKKDFVLAKNMFLEVARILPNYKKTSSYLARIDQDIQQQNAEFDRQRLARAETLYQQANTLQNQKKDIDAYQRFMELEAFYPDYKATRSAIEKMKQAFVAQGVSLTPVGMPEHPVAAQENPTPEDLALADYEEAVRLFKQRKTDAARAKFQDVEKIFSDYRSTRKYLAEIDAADQRKAQEEARALAAQAAAEERRQAREAEQRQRAEARELQQKADAAYRQGVQAFRDKKYPVARENFKEALNIVAGYRDSGRYLARIDEAENQKTTEAAPQGIKAPAGVQNVQDIDEKKETAPSLGKVERVGEYEAKVAKAEPLYARAIELYQAKRYDDAQAKLDEVARILPKYKSTEEYRALIAKSKSQKTAEELKKEAAELQDLSTRSAGLYRQIRSLSADRDMAGVTRTFSKIDRIIANLEQEQARISREIERQEEAARKAAAKQAKEAAAAAKAPLPSADKTCVAAALPKPAAEVAKTPQQQKADDERQRKAEAERQRQELFKKEKEQQEKARQEALELQRKAEDAYRQAVEAFRSKKYSVAREYFGEAVKYVPSYRDVAQYLVRMDRAEGELKILAEENADKEAIARLAEKANTVNADALQCSQEKNFICLQSKFSDLAGLLKEIQVLKDRMQERREKFAASWEARADEAKKKEAMKEKIGKMKADAEQQACRENARKAFREGEMFYANGNYPEAKAKFLEAAKLDVTLRAARTYVERIDRIISKRDYEDQKLGVKKEKRDLERRQEKKEGLIADGPAGEVVTDPARAKTVYDEGIAFYKIQRYREARIKFEEASKVGDESQRRKADRYLKLTETALENERQKTENDKRQAEDRYLATKRALDRVSYAPNTRQDPEAEDRLALAKAKSEAEVDSQIEIRMIEQQNALERSRMLQGTAVADKNQEKEKKTEDGKYKKISRQEKVAPVTQDKVKEEVLKPAVVAQQKPEKIVPAGKKTESQTRKILKQKTGINAVDAREAQRFKKIAAEERARQAREERQLAALERERTIILKNRRAAQKALDAAVEKPAGAQKPVAPKPQAVKKEMPSVPVKESKTSSAFKDDAKAAQEEKARLLRLAAEEEKRLLDQQRNAIQKDFEEGVSRLYGDAVSLFNKALYEESREIFQEVQVLIPGYKKTDEYLRLISQKVSVPRATP